MGKRLPYKQFCIKSTPITILSPISRRRLPIAHVRKSDIMIDGADIKKGVAT